MVLFGVQIKRLRHLSALLPLPLTVFSVMKKNVDVAVDADCGCGCET